MKAPLILGLMLLGVSTVLPAEEAFPSKVILKDSRHYAAGRQAPPSLIPTRLLEIPYDQWSADNRSRAPRGYFEKFNNIVEAVRIQGNSGQCTPGKGFPEENHTPKSGVRSFSIFEVARGEKNILLGEVVATEPAWDPQTLQIYSLVHLKVQKVVRGLDTINQGDIVIYRRPWGTATIRGVTLCSYANGVSLSPPRTGQEVPERLRPTFLILGRLVPGNGLFLDTQDYEEFQIIDGRAHYPPGISIYYDKKPEDLGEFLLSFQVLDE